MEKLDLSLGANVNANDLYTDSNKSSVLDTDLYAGLLKYVYFTTAKSGTTMANAVVEINGLSRTFSMCITYKDTKKPTKVENGKTSVIPGYKQLNSLVYCACEKNLDNVEQEEKSILIHDFKKNEDVPTMVMTIKDVMNTKVGVGIKKVLKHKTALINGNYVPTTDTYYANEVDNWYTADGFSAKEKVTDSEPVSAVKWKEKKGQIFEEKLKTAPIAPPTQATAMTQASSKPVASLFDDD